MLEACLALIDRKPLTPAQWAAAALGSQVRATAIQPKLLQDLTGRRFDLIRAGGGGSRSEAFRTKMEAECGLAVVLGPAEATVVGNLALQLRSKGVTMDHSL
jgi:rhamnulokinase